MNKFKSAHGTIRGLEAVPASSQFEGRFGRMFRTLPPAVFTEEDLKSLASVMVAEAEAEQTPKPNRMPRRTRVSARAIHIWASSSITTSPSTRQAACKSKTTPTHSSTFAHRDSISTTSTAEAQTINLTCTRTTGCTCG